LPESLLAFSRAYAKIQLVQMVAIQFNRRLPGTLA
jgi:hypothetical protein